MSLVEFSTRRRVTVAMATLTLVLFGWIALGELRINLLPELSYPTLTVRTEYTGAAPSEIETLITEPVEEAVGVVKGLRKLRSVSRTGQSDVILEFAWGTDMDLASIEVRDKLEVLRLPLEASKPVLLRFNPSTEPVMRLVLAGSPETAARGQAAEEAELKQLRRHADDEIKRLLEPTPGVAAVKVSGGLEDEVQVLLDQQQLARLNLGPAQVIQRLRQENVNISGGRIEDGSQRYLVRTVNQFVDLEQMRQLLVTTLDGVPVRMRDIATITQSYKEREAIIRLGGREAVELALYKEGDANTVAMADAVLPQLERLKRDLPPGATLTVIDDQSVFIRQALSDVKSEAVIGGLLAILVIFLFLRDGWSTLVIGISLPVSIIATFFFMGQLGLSLNVMSLAGLALATGMVVDDSIVVLESIAKARERGLGLIEAAIVGTREVGMAVIASTLTTVAVFVPLVFVHGIAGQLFGDQALTVAIAVIISTVVALSLIPMLSSLKARPPMAFPDEPEDDTPLWRQLVDFGRRMAVWPVRSATRLPVPVLWAVWGLLLPLKLLVVLPVWLLVTLFAFLVPWAFGRAVRGAKGGGRGLGWVLGRPLDWLAARVQALYERFANAYSRLLPKALARPAVVLGGATGAFVLALLLAPTLGMDLVPQLAQDRFEMTVKLPPGTQLRDTDALVRQLQRSHEGDPDIRALYGVSGSGTRLDASPTESGENIGKLTVVLAGGQRTEAAVTQRLREGMERHPGVEVEFSRPELFAMAAPLEIELRGSDLAQLEVAGRELVRRMSAHDRFVDIKSTVEGGHPEIRIEFDQERAAALGLTTREIADQVVRQVRGEVATRYSFRDRKIDVLVRAQESDRRSVADIRRLIVNPASARPVTLDAVADVVQAVGPSEIHRTNQNRVAIVSANLAHGDLGSAIGVVERLLAEAPLAAGVRASIGGQGEELDASTRSMLFAFALAVFLVYLVMASQFESFLHPFVIMFTIPLAVVGAVVALFLTGNTISVVVFIGLILLAGIVVKNAIVLIDRVNQLRAAGLSKREAILQGCAARLRPVIMTTVTTLVGFTPLALGLGDGSEVRAPMAITVIGGLALSTLLTLVVIPVVYDLLDRKSDEAFVASHTPIALDPAGEGGA